MCWLGRIGDWPLLIVIRCLQEMVPPITLLHSQLAHLLQHLLHFEPLIRFEAAGALKHEFFPKR